MSGGRRLTKVDYQAPPSIREGCQKQRERRHNKMKEVLVSDPNSSEYGQRWIPDEQDLEDERNVFVARDMICQNNFGLATYSMHPDSLARMKKGLEPLRKADKEWVSRTPK